MYVDYEQVLKLLVLILNTIFVLGLQCSSRDRKGPFELDQQRTKISAPSKIVVQLERVQVTRDATIAILERSYYQSYCYQGGPLDPNTGCFNEIKQSLPGYEEASEWVAKNKCAIGQDCTDCWGTDAEACLRPEETPKHWVDQKELIAASNNNHFAFHTCNLHWKCSLHTVKFPTFISRRRNRWTFYTEYQNGTKLSLDFKDFWTLGNMVLKKTIDPLMDSQNINASCFTNEKKPMACYDSELGNFVEFGDQTGNWTCTGQTCYNLNSQPGNEITSNQIVDLKAASKEDLYRVIEMEHMLNEELRYNFGLVLDQLADIRGAIVNVVLSSAKGDDKLIGNVIGQNVRSQFVNEKMFYLIPCKDVEIINTNCVGNLTFRNGRWQENNNQTECLSFNNTSTINLIQPKQLWFPDIIDEKPIGTVENFDGWTYYAQEQDSIQKAIQWTQNLQSTTSIADIANYPKGFIEDALTGFITLHAIAYGMLTIIIIYLYKKLHSNTTRRARQVIEGETGHQLQNVITVYNTDTATRTRTSDRPIKPICKPSTLKLCEQPMLKEQQITKKTEQLISSTSEQAFQDDQPPQCEAAHPLRNPPPKIKHEDLKLGWIN